MRLASMATALVILYGLILGSFLNVCIHRLPLGESIVRPASRCPHCAAPIRPYNNIPLLSYILLRGRCPACSAPISARYPLVEALTALAAWALFVRFPNAPLLLGYGAFVAALIVVTFIDLDHQIIPDVISLPGIVVGLLWAACGFGPTWWPSVAGVVVGGGSLYTVAFGYYALTGREGMGGGDIKLLAMIGAFLGWQGVVVTLIIGSLSGSVVGVMLMAALRRGRHQPIPFGPFLAAGAICALFFGDELIAWYIRSAFPATS